MEESKVQNQVHGVDEQETTETSINPVAADIRRERDWVKQGIEEILAQQPQLTFRAEDVYAECVSGEAILWVAPEGFVITSTEFDRFNGQKSLLVWLAWAKELGNNCVIKYWDFFATVAKEAKYSKLMVKTPVTKLEPYLLKQGWIKETVLYTRELV